MNKDFKNVAIHKSTYDKARLLAKIQDRSIASVVEDLISKVFDVAGTFTEANLEFETCITESRLVIEVKGRNRLITGSFEVPTSATDKQTDKAIRKRLKKP